MARHDTARPTGDLLRSAADSVSALLRQEIRQGEAEMLEKARRSAKGAALLAGAGGLAVCAVAAATATTLRLLESVLPRPVAAMAATLAFGGGAAALGTAAVRELRTIDPLPERTIDSLRDDLGAVADGSSDRRDES